MKKEIDVFLSSAKDAMMAVDINGKITLFNRAAESITKFQSNNVIGKPVKQVIKSTRLLEILRTGATELNRRQPLGDTTMNY